MGHTFYFYYLFIYLFLLAWQRTNEWQNIVHEKEQGARHGGWMGGTIVVYMQALRTFLCVFLQNILWKNRACLVVLVGVNQDTHPAASISPDDAVVVLCYLGCWYHSIS